MFIEKIFRYNSNPPSPNNSAAVTGKQDSLKNTLGIPVCVVISDKTSQHTQLFPYTFIIQEADRRWEKETIRRNDGECSVEGGAEED